MQMQIQKYTLPNTVFWQATCRANSSRMSFHWVPSHPGRRKKKMRRKKTNRGEMTKRVTIIMGLVLKKEKKKVCFQFMFKFWFSKHCQFSTGSVRRQRRVRLVRRGEGRGDGCGGEGRYLCIFVFLHFCIFLYFRIVLCGGEGGGLG